MQKSGLALLAMYYYDFREKEKKYLRGLLSSILCQLYNQPIPITLSFPRFIRHPTMVLEVPATTNLSGV